MTSRSWVRLLLDPQFGPFFLGRLISTMGQWIHNTSAVIVVYALTGDALLVGMVSVAQFGPQMLLAPLSGRMADQGNPVRQMIIGRIVTTSGCGSIALMIWFFGGIDGLPSAWLIIGACLVVGVGLVTGAPAMHAILPTLVRPQEVGTAVMLNSTPMTVSRAAGPAVGALLLTSAGPTAAFASAAGANALFAIILIVTRPQTAAAEPGTDLSIRAGLRFLWSDRPLKLLLLGTAASTLGAEPAITLAPPIAARLGLESQFVGYIASSFGCGCAAGIALTGLARRWCTSAMLACMGLTLLAGGLVSLTLWRQPTFTLVAFALCGIGMTAAFSSTSVLIQERTPAEFRGRVMALWTMAFLGTRPLSASINGLVADLVSLDWALWVTGGLVLAAAAACRPSRTSPRP